MRVVQASVNHRCWTPAGGWLYLGHVAMSSLDRHQWLRAAWALLALALAIVFAAWFITSLLPLDQHKGTAVIESDVLLAADIVGVLLGVALYAVIKMVLAGRRQACVGAAINGNQDALPLTNVAREYSVARDDFEDVVATWPHPLGSVCTSLFACLFMGALAAFIGAWPVYFVLEALHAPVPAWLIDFLRSSSPADTRRQAVGGPRPSFVGALLSAILILGSMSLFGLIASLASLRAAMSQPARIVANHQGIMRQSVWNRRRFIPWHEARLLEVATASSGQQGQPRWLCRLYSWTSAIQWPLPANTTLSLHGDPFVLVTRCVIARTGLQPRTLDAKLLPPGLSMPASFLDRIQIRVVPTLAMAAMGVGMLAFGEVGPSIFTGIGIFTIAGALLTLADKWPFQTSKSRGQRVASPGQRSSQAQRLISTRSTGELRTFSANATYEMTVGSYLAFKLNQVMFAALGVAAALFGASMLGLSYAQDVLHLVKWRMPPLTPIFILLMVSFVLGGVATAVVSVRARDTIVLSDMHGIRKRWLLGNTFILWDHVDRMELRQLAGTFWIYRVVGNEGRATISWPIAPFHPSLKAQEPHAILLTPREMAALVVQRTGKSIQHV
jgi:hypothetical protein